MTYKISSLNLFEVIEKNKRIEKKVDDLVNYVISLYAGICKDRDKLGFHILKEYGLIQIPLNNSNFGGLIYKKGKIVVPILNTVLPRIHQNFIAWHEVYHLLFGDNSEEKHIITVDMEERAANLFASKMLVGSVYQVFKELEYSDFFYKIAYCMDLYKVPYKAILISLFEEAEVYGDKKLQETIIKYFDAKKDFTKIFKELNLDISLLEPTGILAVEYLKNCIIEKLKKEPRTYHQENAKFFFETVSKIKKLVNDGEKKNGKVGNCKEC